jgi:hypothetical protein
MALIEMMLCQFIWAVGDLEKVKPDEHHIHEAFESREPNREFRAY